MKSILNIQYSDVSEKFNRLNLYLPEEDCKAVVIYIHGGGLIINEPGDHYWPFMGELCNRGIGVAAIEYRGFPQYAYPDFIKDSACAVAWVKNHINEYTKCDKIYICGSSAGGYISMMLCFDKKYLGMYGISPMDISGFIHNSAQPTAHFNVLKSRGIDPKRVIIDETAPLYHIGADSEYPPMLLAVTDNDIENRYEQTMLVKSTLKSFGHDESVYMKVLPGKHCGFIHSSGTDNVFADLVTKFIEDTD